MLTNTTFQKVDSYLPECPQRMSDTGHMCLQQQLTGDTQKLFTATQIHWKTEEVGGDFGIFVMNLLLEVSNLTNFMVICRVKM